MTFLTYTKWWNSDLNPHPTASPPPFAWVPTPLDHMATRYFLKLQYIILLYSYFFFVILLEKLLSTQIARIKSREP